MVKLESSSYAEIVDALDKVKISFFQTSKILIDVSREIIRYQGNGVDVADYTVIRIDIQWIADEYPEDDSVDVTVTLCENRPAQHNSNKVVITTRVDEQDFDRLK